MRLHINCTALLLAITLLIGSTDAVRADTALQQFNDIYGDKVRKATSSRDTRQQLALATQLMGDAEQLGPAEIMKAELYLKTADFALADQGGDQLARKAVEKLQSLSGEAAAEGRPRADAAAAISHGRSSPKIFDRATTHGSAGKFEGVITDLLGRQNEKTGPVDGFGFSTLDCAFGQGKERGG